MRATRSGESALLLVDVVEVFVRSGSRYAVIGALAASVYGAVRASLDADVLLSTDPSRVPGIRDALTAAGLISELTPGGYDDPIPAVLKVVDRFGNRVDILLGLRGLDPSAFSRVQSVPFRGQEIQFIGREDFIAMKAFAGGPLDLADASRAILAAGKDLDRELVRKLARGFGRDAADSLEKVLPAEP